MAINLSERRVEMDLSCNLVNVYTKLLNCLLIYTNMTANNKTQLVLSHDYNNIIESNGKQLYV